MAAPGRPTRHVVVSGTENSRAVPFETARVVSPRRLGSSPARRGRADGRGGGAVLPWPRVSRTGRS